MNTRSDIESLTQSLSAHVRDHQHQMVNMVEVVNALTKRVRSLEGEIACLVAVVNDSNGADRPRLVI